MMPIPAIGPVHQLPARPSSRQSPQTPLTDGSAALASTCGQTRARVNAVMWSVLWECVRGGVPGPAGPVDVPQGPGAGAV